GRRDSADRSDRHAGREAHRRTGSARRADSGGGGGDPAARAHRAPQGRAGAIPDGARQLSYAYIDTSCLVALVFGEPGAGRVRARLQSYERLYAANLLEAELRAALQRERVAWQEGLVTSIGWVLPPRRLTDEIARVLDAGYLRG